MFDMFDWHFNSIGSFTDPNVASQYPGNTAFQVENEDGKLFVTFAGFTPPFGGVVDIFDYEGNLLTPNHFAANQPGAGPLANPWAITRAPAHFGPFSQRHFDRQCRRRKNQCVQRFRPIPWAITAHR